MLIFTRLINNECTDLVPYGYYLTGTMHYPRYNIILQHMVSLTSYLYGIVVGLMLSDAWMSKKNMNGQARLFIKQSINNAFYLFYTFSLLSHYCSSYPRLRRDCKFTWIYCCSFCYTYTYLLY